MLTTKLSMKIQMRMLPGLNSKTVKHYSSDELKLLGSIFNKDPTENNQVENFKGLGNSKMLNSIHTLASMVPAGK